jgi:hypothetical protein
MKRDLYTEVTSRILAELEQGAAPWVKPWSATPGLNHPHNAATGRPYSGCNVILLWMTAQRRGFAHPASQGRNRRRTPMASAPALRYSVKPARAPQNSPSSVIRRPRIAAPNAHISTSSKAPCAAMAWICDGTGDLAPMRNTPPTTARSAAAEP